MVTKKLIEIKVSNPIFKLINIFPGYFELRVYNENGGWVTSYKNENANGFETFNSDIEAFCSSIEYTYCIENEKGKVSFAGFNKQLKYSQIASEI